MNSENSKTSDSHRLLLNIKDKIDLKNSDKYVALSNIRTCYTSKNIKKLYKSNKLKISSPTWNNKFQLPDESFFALDIEDHFEYITKNMRQ